MDLAAVGVDPEWMSTSLFGASAVAQILCISALHRARLRNARRKHPKQTVSAPGKVLMAGGYLVLEQPNVGIVIGATARFHSTVDLGLTSIHQQGFRIVVHSPQFYKRYEYCLDLSTFELTAAGDQSPNVFVEKCLQITLIFLKEFMGQEFYAKVQQLMNAKCSLEITLHADNDFYSQIQELQRRNMPVTASSLKKLPKFQPCPRDEDGNAIVAKTGMGSSAALTTALVGSLLAFFGVASFPSANAKPADLSMLHNLAQVCHAIAQGKVGSGFDVAAAVYGSHKYFRFNPSVIAEVLDTTDPVQLGPLLHKCVMGIDRWDHSVLPLALPQGLELMMGDVCGGSETPSMVRKVLQWRKENPNASGIWDELARINNAIADAFEELQALSQTEEVSFVGALVHISGDPASNWTKLASSAADEIERRVIERLIAVREHVIKARRLLKQMGDEAGVPIEPDQQTLLADATQNLPGVLCAGVPGAGGVDAIFAIVMNSHARERVEELWGSWSSRHEGNPMVCPLLLASAGHKQGAGACSEPSS